MHRLLIVGTGLLMVISCLLAGTAWRLAQGPINLGWLSDGIRAAVADDTAALRVSFDGVVLAWEGFDKGVDYPLDLRLSDIVITDSTGRRVVTAPTAHLTFSLAGLLLGHIIPRAIEVDHAQAAVTRDTDGAINLGWDLGGSETPQSGSIDLRQIREQISRPVSSDHGRIQGLFDQIQRVHFRDTELTFRDQATGLVVRTSGMGLDLFRAKGGRIHGALRAPLLIADQQVELVVATDWVPDSGIKLTMKLTPIRLADVAPLPANLAFMAGLDVPISFTASATCDTNFMPHQVQAEIQVGQGRIQVAQGTISLRSGTVSLSGAPDRLNITTGRFDLAHTPNDNPEIIDISGTILRGSNRVTASMTVGLGHFDIADLPLLWPPGIAKGARSWVTENVTGGMVTQGTGSFVIESDAALNDTVVTRASGELDGINGTFTWIDNMPPVGQAAVHLHLVDPDVLDIQVSSARQHIRNSSTDLLVKDGRMRITGLSVRDQTAVIQTQVEGSIESALALLKEPRLHLLSEHPIALKVGGGDASATLNFQFPLDTGLQVDDVQLHVDAHLNRVRLLDIAGGRELTDGVFDLGIGKEGLSLKGQGALASIPVMLEGSMDFKPGPPQQIVQRIVVTGQPDARQLDAAGLHVTDFVGGLMPTTAVVIERRNGEGSVAVTSDLTLASLSVTPLAWNKPPASAANASATLLMSHGRLTKIDRIAVRGDGLLVTGSANFSDGHPRSVILDSIRLGRTQGHGTVHLAANEPITIVLQGDEVDLSSKLSEKTAGGLRLDTVQATTPNWQLDARFDHAILTNDVRAVDVLVKAAGVGGQVRSLDAVGSTSASSAFSIKIEPQAGKRHLLVDAKDAGSFLRGVDAIRVMQSGHLTIDGIFNRPSGLYPLVGTAVIDDVVVKNSPVLGKMLQAITLYGLVDALRGPGMGFSHIVVPFQYDGANLDVDQAYAQNPSLGLTAKGRIDLSGAQTSLTGTIVPVYFFNSMLGQLPLVGKFFSPETGGGIFAVRFGLDGQIADPSISINPVSALTPGFLREIFGVFDHIPTGLPGGKDATPRNGQ